ncbi:MAG: PIN domain-containing protein [Elusimicrobia bacterium]|nr:PIN domain-containing protein [Elusimicrobiota bacterium]
MIFIDTGAFLGRYLTADQFHARAVAGWTRLAKEGERCCTSNFVLDETLTLLARRANYAFAADRGRAIRNSKALEILRPSEKIEGEALDLFEKFADQRVSFTDCVSFALMRERRVKRAFAFDEHFARAGFALWP